VLSSAIGHLLELIPPEGFEPVRGKWKLENLPALPPEFALQPIDKTTTRLNLLKRLIKRKDVGALINACDAGREGELIFRNLAKASGTAKPIQRLWLQSMTPESIRAAFQRLRSDEEMRPLADAAVSRSEADWLVGINSTRALTAFNSQIGGFQKTTAGRVQTPTLAIIVEREEKIRAFTPRTYFEVFGDFGVSAGQYRGRWFDPAFKKNQEEDARAERIWDRAKADAIKAKCDGKPGAIEEEKKPTTQAPPLLYDLTSLQREANGRFGFPARMTLQIAQQLYEKHKALTYPRTDSRYLPEDHLGTAKRVMGSFADRDLAQHAEKALRQDWVKPTKRIFNNAKVSDHFAIVPTGEVPRNLDEKQEKIFDMVARRFIAVFYPAAQFEITTRITTVEQEKFKTEGKIIVDPGWLAVYGRQAEDGESDKAIVAITPGEPARTLAIEVKENETKPPPRFNEATLLSAMEGAGKLIDDEALREAMSEKGLGTPATRASIIEGLIFEGYMDRQNRDLIATAKGISLITLLRNLQAETLCKPELTGEWESKLKRMERGELGRDEFMRQIRGLTSEIVEKVKRFRRRPDPGGLQAARRLLPAMRRRPVQRGFPHLRMRAMRIAHLEKARGSRVRAGGSAHTADQGKVGPLAGFRSKMGRTFEAAVQIGEVENEEKTAKEWKVTFAFENNGAGGGAKLDLTTAKPLGETPHGALYETETAYLCQPAARVGETHSDGQGHLPAGHPARAGAEDLPRGKTDLLPRFISKKGKPFSAFLKLEGNKVTFEFEPRAKKKPAPKKKPPTDTDSENEPPSAAA
jgi:DNA topoisomerase-3